MAPLAAMPNTRSLCSTPAERNRRFIRATHGASKALPASASPLPACAANQRGSSGTRTAATPYSRPIRNSIPRGWDVNGSACGH